MEMLTHDYLGRGWMRSWLSEAMGGLPPPHRGQAFSQEIKGIFLLESLAWAGGLDFTGALFTEFCGGGKNFIYSKIPVFFYSHPHMSENYVPSFPPYELLTQGLSFRLDWKVEKLKVGRAFSQFCRWKTLIPCVLIDIVQYHVSQTEIQI